MKWKIVTDSGADIRNLPQQLADVSFESVPLLININNNVYVDTAELDTAHLIDTMEESATASSTACPSPNTYAEAFEGADNVLCLTISGSLSGSYNSALLGRDLALEKNPNANIYVYDTKTAGTEINLLVRYAVQLLAEDPTISLDSLVTKLDHYHQNTRIVFMLESADNLVKNGRVSKLLGTMIGFLGIRLIGMRNPEGTIELAHKSKGSKRTLKTIFEDMMTHGYNGGKVEISHAHNEEFAEGLKELIWKQFPLAEINIVPCTGLCCYYAQRNGMIIGYESSKTWEELPI